MEMKRALKDRPFPLEDPYVCPQCKQESVIGLLLANEQQEHMHTWYVCTFWPSGKGEGGVVATQRCGWTGWRVPRRRTKIIKDVETVLIENKSEQELADLAYPNHSHDAALGNYRSGHEVWDTNGDQW